MPDWAPAHFFTRLGPLCGALRPRHWTVDADEAECWACRALLNAGIRERQVPGLTSPLGVIPTPRVGGD